MKRSALLLRIVAASVFPLVLHGSANAATVTFRNTLDDGTGAHAIATASLVPFDNTDSDPANNGAGVIGRMTISNAAILAFWNAGNVAAIQAAFQPFGMAFTLESTGLAGAFLDSRTADTRASQNSFGASPVYLWAYTGFDIPTATEHLIAQLGADFPTDPETGAPLSVLANLRPGEVASIVVGGFGNFSVDYDGGSGPLPGFNTVVLVPEPASTALLLFGLMWFLPWRRRNNSLVG